MGNVLIENKHQSAETSAIRTAGRGRAGKPPLNLPPVIGHDQIAARARTIWQAKGCPQGCDEQNWLEAEVELRQESRLV